MADEIHQFAVTVPAGTKQATPATFDLKMSPRQVDQVDIRIPPGPRGQMGFALGAAGVAVLPLEPGAFIVGDGETISWQLEKQFDSGAWQLKAYNTGTYAHSLYVTFRTRVIPPPGSEAGGFRPIASDTLGGVLRPGLG